MVKVMFRFSFNTGILYAYTDWHTWYMTGVPLLVFEHENKSTIIEARAGIGIFNSGQLQKFTTKWSASKLSTATRSRSTQQSPSPRCYVTNMRLNSLNGMCIGWSHVTRTYFPSLTRWLLWTLGISKDTGKGKIH